MKQAVRKFLSYAGILLICISLTGCFEKTNQSVEQMIDQTAKSIQKLGKNGEVLAEEDLMIAGNSSSDWVAMTLAFSGREDAYDDYLERLKSYVMEQYEINGGLHQVKATEYHRIALTMLALGEDPSAVEYQGKCVDLIADGTYEFAGGSPGLQGSNGLIYALLVLDAADTEIPEEASVDRETLIEELFTYQQSDGGFCLDLSLGSDIDITAMALQALAPYRGNETVNKSVEQALSWLSENMTEDGYFVCYGDKNAESCAQVILAFCALGMDPETAEMFQKEQTVLDALNSFRRKDGMYQHIENQEEGDLMATYQALLALEAVEAFRTEGRWIFDFQ